MTGQLFLLSDAISYLYEAVTDVNQWHLFLECLVNYFDEQAAQNGPPPQSR